jgi:dTDP-4-dehydrorhamnose 3,5-epimerase
VTTVFHRTAIDGAYRVETTRFTDDRGGFENCFNAADFAQNGLMAQPALASLSTNHKAGTVRGLHFQTTPVAEAKLVRCLQGALLDVAVDIRPTSPSFGQIVVQQLQADDGLAMYWPAGCAHGFQTLVDDTQLLYLLSTPYAPAHARGIRHDDPALGIDWPLPIAAISDRDRAWPSLAEHLRGD